MNGHRPATTLQRTLRTFPVDSLLRDMTWAVTGPYGAVSLTVRIAPLGDGDETGIPSQAAGVSYTARDISIHYPTPPADVSCCEHEGCVFLGGRRCWFDSALGAADRLVEVWAAYGFDDEVVYGELADWYVARFPAVPLRSETWPVRCVHCQGPVGGLLASCRRAGCVPLEIAEAVALDRAIEASEQ